MAKISRLFGARLASAIAASISIIPAVAEENIYLLQVPDYTWHAGCFGTASGNLMAFWDRNGLANMYTGPTGGGVAPLSSAGANASIRSLWASQAGLDGRPLGSPGHIDDYWESAFSFESTAPDPYSVLGRAEHSPDCLGDFMGQSQRKYQNLAGECAGNIDGYAFNFWDKTGNRRTDFTPPGGVRDIQSGLRKWSEYRGYDAVVSSQLVDVTPEAPTGTGFTFEDIKAEINAGFPVLLILQNHGNYSRTIGDLPNANPMAHAILVHGYVTYPSEAGEVQAIRFKTSWGQGDEFAQWNSDLIIASLPMRGAITFHPQPRITKMERIGSQLRLEWEGPNATLQNELSGAVTPAHGYVVERTTDLASGTFTAVTPESSLLEALVNKSNEPAEFFRVRLVAN
jgi:hypothetical protein